MSSSSSPTTWGPFKRESVLFWLAVLGILNYVVLAFWYVGLDNFFSYTEPNISGTAWVFMEGGPLYHPVDAAEQYSTVYGPYVYILNGIFLKLFGPGIASTKIAEALFAIGSILGVIFAAGRVTSFRTGIIAGGMLVGTYFAFWPFSTFIARADALILGMAGLAVAAVQVKNKWLAVVLCALALGMATGVKIHAAMYFLPTWILLYQRFGFSAFLVAGFAGCAVTLAPFALLPNVSLVNHVEWLNLVSNIGYELRLFIGNMRNMILLQLLPALLLLSILPKPFEILKRDRLFVGTLIFCFVVIMTVASVEGAGKFHLLPFSVVMVFWLARTFHGNYSAETATPEHIRYYFPKVAAIYILLIVMVLNAFPVNRRMVKLMNEGGRFNGAVADIAEILAAYPGKKIGMGDGETKSYTLTWFRPLLIFAGNPFLIDSTMIMARRASGYDVAPKTIAAIESCVIDIWLIPQANKPFAIDSIFAGRGYTYPEEFRRVFLETYRKGKRVGLFDLWICRKAG